MKISESGKWFLASLYTAAIIYLLTSFGVGSFNPADWGAANVFLFIIGSVLIIGAVSILFDE
jgi:hypothetical protein